jgi:hypothetical protein
MASSPLDKKFIEDVTKSLNFASVRQSNPCRYDKATSACYQRNSEHFSKCSHPIRFCKGDIAAFKPNTDRFLSNSLKIYKANKNDFSLEWLREVGARRGDESIQLAQSNFKKYDSFYFLLLANIIINLEDYVDNQHYTPKFLYNLLRTFESADATGLFKVDKESEIAKKLKSGGLDDQESLLLGNTTIQKCIEHLYPTRYNKMNSSGGTKSIRKKSIRKKSKSKTSRKSRRNSKSKSKSKSKRNSKSRRNSKTRKYK